AGPRCKSRRRSEEAIKEGEWGTSGAARSGVRSLAAVRAEGTRVNPDSKGAPLFSASKGPEKLEKGFLFVRFELFEFLGDLLGLAFVANDGVEKRDRGAVVHQARVQTHTP